MILDKLHTDKESLLCTKQVNNEWKNATNSILALYCPATVWIPGCRSRAHVAHLLVDLQIQPTKVRVRIDKKQAKDQSNDHFSKELSTISDAELGEKLQKVCSAICKQYNTITMQKKSIQHTPVSDRTHPFKV